MYFKWQLHSNWRIELKCIIDLVSTPRVDDDSSTRLSPFHPSHFLPL